MDIRFGSCSACMYVGAGGYLGVWHLKGMSVCVLEVFLGLEERQNEVYFGNSKDFLQLNTTSSMINQHIHCIHTLLSSTQLKTLSPYTLSIAARARSNFFNNSCISSNPTLNRIRFNSAPYFAAHSSSV